MKYIYFDQNFWIFLINGLNSDNAHIVNLIDDLKKKIKNNELKIVISFVNAQETLKDSNENRRNRLWNFMIDLSEGNVIFPFSKEIIDCEVKNLFYKRVYETYPEVKEIDVKSIIFGKGIPAIIGREVKIKSQKEISEEQEKEIIEKITPDYSKRVQDSVNNIYSQTQKFEDVRRKERANMERDLGNRVVMVNYLTSMILPLICDFQSKMKFSRDFILKKGSSKKDILKLFQELPSAYTYFILNDMRNRELQKDIEDNDLYDIVSLAMAIPYCDIVVGEKRFISIAKNQKLDKLFDTKLILSSHLDEFKKAISS